MTTPEVTAAPMEQTSTKRCTYCKIEKPLELFNKNRTKKDGRGNGCRECTKVRCREWYEANRERARELSRDWHKRNPDKAREAKLKRNFGINADDYQRLLFAQGGGCAICGKPDSRARGKKFLYVDHSHGSGAIRGLLCGWCNSGLGYFEDNATRLLNAAAYLRRVNRVSQTILGS